MVCRGSPPQANTSFPFFLWGSNAHCAPPRVRASRGKPPASASASAMPGSVDTAGGLPGISSLFLRRCTRRYRLRPGASAPRPPPASPPSSAPRARGSGRNLTCVPSPGGGGRDTRGSYLRAAAIPPFPPSRWDCLSSPLLLTLSLALFFLLGGWDSLGSERSGESQVPRSLS